MSNFTKYNTELEISYHKTASYLLNKSMWVVKTPFTYYIGSINSEELVNIPLGFLTDGASVPRIFWNILPPWGQYGQATVVHDWLCENGEIIKNGKAVAITRKMSDSIFKEALQALQVPKWKVWLMSTGVSLYRKLYQKRDPEVSINKKLIEQIIAKNSETGEYELSVNQVNEIQSIDCKFKV